MVIFGYLVGLGGMSLVESFQLRYAYLSGFILAHLVTQIEMVKEGKPPTLRVHFRRTETGEESSMEVNTVRIIPTVYTAFSTIPMKSISYIVIIITLLCQLNVIRDNECYHRKWDGLWVSVVECGMLNFPWPLSDACHSLHACPSTLVFLHVIYYTQQCSPAVILSF